MKDDWKQLGRYLVSPQGGVYSTTGWRGQELRALLPSVDDDGYDCVRMVLNGERKKYRVHRLVAELFLDARPTPEHEIRHLDGNKLNNRVDNLTWGTRAENAADRERHGRTSRGETHSAAIRASNQAEGTRAFRRSQKESSHV